jgi:hypothetical protein
MADPTYSPVLRVGLLGTVTNVLSSDMTVSRCSRCGAATDVPVRHTAWHNENDAAITAATNLAGGARSAASAAQDAAAMAQASANAALQEAASSTQAIANTSRCSVCRATVRTALMNQHLGYHYSRALNDPIESPTSAQIADPTGSMMSPVTPLPRV